MDDQEKMVEESYQLIKSQFDDLPQKPVCASAEPEEIFIPMTDGIMLRTVIRKPDASGPFPTIFVRTCYPISERIQQVQAAEYSARGFAYVYQFCRGTGGSQGKWEPNVNERADGKTAIDWLNEQTWVESIGYFGSSYLALTGWAIADILPDKVKTLYLTHYGTDRFTSAYKNGLFRQDILTAWAMGNAGFPVTADYMESARFRPQAEVDEKMWGGRLDWYRDWITNTQRGDAYWQQGFWKLLSEIPSKVRVPVYIGEGWYDHHLGSALKTWEALSPESKRRSVLWIGAWNHGFAPCVEDVQMDNLENSDVQAAFEWFDAILRQNIEPKTDVRVYQIGADKWVHMSAYPFKNSGNTVFYLSGETLSEIAPPVEDNKSYCYDPDNPLIIHGAESMFMTMTSVGSLRQPECGVRDDVLSFVSAPVDREIDVLGKIKVDIYVSSDAEDTAFTARLMEVREDGAYNIRGSIATLAFRNSEWREDYTPGVIVKLTVEMWDVAWRVQKGSRLRLDISSSAFPEYAVHTNRAGVWSLHETASSAKQTLYFGGIYPSKINLPVMPKDIGADNNKGC